MSPAFAAWVRGHGREIASFPSDVYGSVELWQVGSGPFDAQADTVDIPAGVFINTTGSRCGGFRVKNSPGSPLYTTFMATGGKARLGPPRSSAFRTGSGSAEQLFDGGVLVALRPGLSAAQPRLLPVVADLAVAAPARYAAAHLPPVVEAKPTGVRPAWLADSDIRRAYLGSSRLSAASVARGLRNFGAPLGPPRRVGDDLVAQAFAGAVLEHALGSDDVHAADIAGLLESTGVVVVPRAARHLVTPPALPPLSPPTIAQPTTVVPFLLTLGAALGGFAVIIFVLSRRRRPFGLSRGVRPDDPTLAGAGRRPRDARLLPRHRPLHPRIAKRIGAARGGSDSRINSGTRASRRQLPFPIQDGAADLLRRPGCVPALPMGLALSDNA